MNELASVIPIFARPGEAPVKRPMPKWSAERRAKFMRTVKRKTKERLQALREERRTSRKGSKGGRPIARPRPSYAYGARRNAAFRDSVGPHTVPQERRSRLPAAEERLDAITFLRTAVEGYEGVPTSVCYSLLALRRLLGQIK